MEGGSVLSSRAFLGGNAGSIDVQAAHIALTAGSLMSSSTSGPGQGGMVRVMATDTLTLAGTSPDGLDRSGIFANAQGTGAGAGNAGSIVVEAPRIILTGGAQIGSGTAGPGQGGTVRVTATDTLSLSGTSPDGRFPSSIFTDAQGTGAGAGNAGSIVVEAPRITLTGGAEIASNTLGRGQGGMVRVTATDTLTLSAGGIFTDAFGTGAGAGNAGSIVVEAPRITLTGSAQIASSTFGPGQGGTARVMATDTLILADRFSGIFVDTEGQRAEAGNAGSLVVDAPRITLTGGAQIGSVTFGPGQGGTARVMATDTLTLAGTSPDGTAPSGIFARSERTGTGNAGNIVVQAPRITLTEGAQISSSTLGPGQGGTIQVTATDTLTLAGTSLDGTAPSGIFTDAFGTGAGAGDAGAIVVEVRTVQVADGARISSNTRSGKGGDIAIDAHQVQLMEGAAISAASAGTGDAGSITITVRDTFRSQRSAVTAAASEATGGNIQITAGSLVRLQDSQLTATVGGGTGNGGNVTIDPEFIVLQGSQITANAVEGNGGRLSLTASKALLKDPSSVITATSVAGLQGEVNTQAPVTSLSGAVAPLPQAFTATPELLRSRCVERLREGTVSRFVLGGRDGVPLEPGSLLLSPLQRVDQETGVQAGQQQQQPPTPQPAWVSSAQAHAREGGQDECGRWIGQPRPSGSPKRRR
jgi:large exoprotein involved in heme utilization and adhesion